MKLIYAFPALIAMHGTTHAQSKLACFDKGAGGSEIFTLTGLQKTDSKHTVIVQFRTGTPIEASAITTQVTKEMDWAGMMFRYEREIKIGNSKIHLQQKIGQSHSADTDSFGSYSTPWTYGEIRCQNVDSSKLRSSL